MWTPSSAMPVSGMAVWPSIATACGCPSCRTEAKRIGGPFRPGGGKGHCHDWAYLRPRPAANGDSSSLKWGPLTVLTQWRASITAYSGQ